MPKILRMQKILRLTGREYKAAVKTKGFLIGLVLAPLLMGGSTIAYFLLKDRVDTSDKRVAVIDRSEKFMTVLAEAAEKRNSKEILEEGTGKKIKPAYYFEEIVPDAQDAKSQLLELSQRVRNGDLYAFLEIGPQVVHPGANRDSCRILFYSRNAALDDVKEWVGWPINNALRQLRLSDAGIRESEVRDLFQWIGVEGMGLVSIDKDTGAIEDGRKADPLEAIMIPIVVIMLMFLMIMISVPGMLNSVMEEKTQRIAEVLLGSMRPFDFMAAKLISGVAVAFTSVLVYLLVGYLALHFTGYEHLVPVRALPWFFVYMPLAIVMFGAWSSALGATCSEPKDAQSLSFLVMIPAIFPMFIYFPILKEPLGSFATGMSLIPPFTPMLMTLRLATPGGIPAWQPYAGMAGVLVCTLFLVWVGGRIFRVGILMQGTPPKLSNIIRWAWKG